MSRAPLRDPDPEEWRLWRPTFPLPWVSRRTTPRPCSTTAGLAPSLHNSQPWAFHLSPTVIELHTDPTRRLPATDPGDRELRVACGAALFTLRLALHGHGVRPVVTRFPDRARPGLVAAVRHGGITPAAPETIRLLDAVPRRHRTAVPSARSPSPHLSSRSCAGRPLPRAARCTSSTTPPGAGHSPSSRCGHTTGRWPTRTSGPSSPRGPGHPRTVPTACRPSPAASPARPARPVGLRDFTAGTGHDRIPGKDCENQPLLAVLTATLPGRAGDVQAGEALQRVLLTATAEGLSVSFLSQLVEVPDVRARLHDLIAATRPPQVVLRIGHGWPTVRTPRRPVADLLRGPGGPDGG